MTAKKHTTARNPDPADEWSAKIRKRIAEGGVHLDEDGWYVDDKTGVLVGPDPEMEGAWAEEDFKGARWFHGEQEIGAEEGKAAFRNALRGRPPLDNPKRAVTMRLDADLVKQLRSGGAGWQTRANDMLRKAAGLPPKK